MRSRAESRRGLEPLLRVAALALLAVSLWRAYDWSDAGRVPTVHARLDGSERAETRDSLAALARAGERVSWSGDLASIALMAEGVREPSAGWRLSVVSDGAARLADSLGTIDSLAAGGATLITHGVRGGLEAQEGATTARVTSAGAARLGRVLVLGRAGWESKFVIAALEEEGWLVDAELRLSDTLVVRQGESGRLSTGTHSAVVVLDTAVGRFAAEIARFVRAGGGLVMAGEGAGARVLGALAPASVLRVVAPRVRSFVGNEPWDALPLHTLGRTHDDAVVIDRRDGAPTVVARRVGAGRVVQAGYADTWRWRMEGEAGSPAAHRAHWSRLVGTAAADLGAADAAAAIRDTSGIAGSGAAGAPLAATIQALGPPMGLAPDTTRRGPALPIWLGGLILALLVAEWASRRTRGAA